MNGVAILSSLFAVLLLQGCGYAQMTYFRKHSASMTDERRDWGLCGGNFLANGQLKAVIDKDILRCMTDKGYLTLNDYYVEQQVSFVSRRTPEKTYIEPEIIRICGFSQLDRKSKMPCQAEPYILKSQQASVVKCMSGHDFEPTLPRQGTAFRIIPDQDKVHPHFCLSLTPRNGKGGVSLFQTRWE